jgi:hypothetical protein
MYTGKMEFMSHQTQGRIIHRVTLHTAKDSVFLPLGTTRIHSHTKVLEEISYPPEKF